MHTRWFHHINELISYADEWDRLAAGVPFRGWTWLSHWWRCYGNASNCELAVLAVFDDRNSLMGLAPFYLESSALSGRVLRLLGSGEVCSDYLGLLCHPAVESLVVDALADRLIEDAAADTPEAVVWDLIELEAIDAQDRGMAAFVQALNDRGAILHQQSGLKCWRIELPTDWESYVASLGKNMRREVRRMERELFDSPRVVLHSASNLGDLPQAMHLLVNLHQQRRKELDQEGCFASPQFAAFYWSTVPELLRRHEVQFHWLALDGRPIAAEFQLAGDGILYAYQAGVATNALEIEPGKLINLLLLREAIRQGYRAFDFLRGNEPYKARFGAKPRAMNEYRIVPRKTVPQLRHGLWLAGKSVKRWMKQSAPVLFRDNSSQNHDSLDKSMHTANVDMIHNR